MKLIKIVKPKQIILVIALISTKLVAQDVKLLDQEINPGAVLDELPLPEPSLIGSFYLYDDWKEGKVVLNNGDLVEDVKLKYDLQNNLLEIKTPKFVKVCTPNLLKEFSLKDDFGKESNYKNITVFDRTRIGILEIKYKNGDHVFAVEPYIEIKEPNYKPTIDMGNRDRKVLKKSNYYLVKKSNMVPFKRNKKSILQLTGEHSDKIEDFIKSNKLSVRQDQGLNRIMEYYISLL